jgi:hypothetical protein
MSLGARWHVHLAFACLSWAVLLTAASNATERPFRPLFELLIVLAPLQAALLWPAYCWARKRSRPQKLGSFGFQFASYLLSGLATCLAFLSAAPVGDARGVAQPPPAAKPDPSPFVALADRARSAHRSGDAERALSLWKEARRAARTPAEAEEARGMVWTVGEEAARLDLDRLHNEALAEADRALVRGDHRRAVKAYRSALIFKESRRAEAGLEQAERARERGGL